MITIEYIYDSYGDIYKTLLSNIPQGKYYDNRAEIIPLSSFAYIKITTDSVGYTHYISIHRENGNTSSFTIVPENEIEVVKIPLTQGAISIGIASTNNPTKSYSKSFTCTYFAVMLMSYAKNIYDSYRKIVNVNKDVYVNEATRIASPVLSLSKQLPNTQSLRTFGLQIIVRALINNAGTMKALEDVCKGIFISTPIIEDIEQYAKFDSGFPMWSGQEYELGKLITLWVRNPGLIGRLYGILLATNEGNGIDYNDDSSLDGDDGHNEYEDSDDPLYPDDPIVTGDDNDKEDGDGTLEIEFDIEFLLPRTDRNLPIPFTKKHPWCDDEYIYRNHLDSSTSLDIGTSDDPFETGMLGQQEIPYKRDGTKASAINKLMQLHTIVNGKAIAIITKIESLDKEVITTEAEKPIITEQDDNKLITEQ